MLKIKIKTLISIFCWHSVKHFLNRLTTKGASAKLRMGDFLDLMCPHTGLASRNKSNFTTTFNVYKVNKDEFEKCRVSGKIFYIQQNLKI